MHVYCINSSNSIKLWAFYPGVPNVEIFYRVDKQEGKFKRLEPDLRGDVYGVTYPGDGVYIPAGCLHAVYTLNSGILVGITWVSAQILKATTAIILHELYSCSIKAIEELEPFLQPLYQAIVVGHRKSWGNTLAQILISIRRRQIGHACQCLWMLWA